MNSSQGEKRPPHQASQEDFTSLPFQLREKMMRRQIVDVESKAHSYDCDREYLIKMSEEDYKEFEVNSKRLIEENSSLLRACNSLKIEKEELKSLLLEKESLIVNNIVTNEKIRFLKLENEELVSRIASITGGDPSVTGGDPSITGGDPSITNSNNIPNISNILGELNSGRLEIKRLKAELLSKNNSSFLEDELYLKLNKSEEKIHLLEEEISLLHKEDKNSKKIEELESVCEELRSNLIISANRQSDLLMEVSQLKGILKGIEAMKKKEN